MVIAPNTQVNDAAQLAERIRREIQGAQWVLTNEDIHDQGIHCSISVGVASTRQQIDCICKLIASADEALYQAKDQGRNRVLVWAPAPALDGALGLPAAAD